MKAKKVARQKSVRVTQTTAPQPPPETSFWEQKSELEKAANDRLGKLLEPLYPMIRPFGEIAEQLGPMKGDLPTTLVEQAITDGFYHFCKALDAFSAVACELDIEVDRHYNLSIAAKHKQVGYRVRSGRAVRHAS